MHSYLLLPDGTFKQPRYIHLAAITTSPSEWNTVKQNDFRNPNSFIIFATNCLLRRGTLLRTLWRMALNQQGYFSILNNRSALAEVGCRSEGVVRDAGAQENKWFGRCLPISSGPAWDVGAALVWADVAGLGVPRTGRRNEHINVMSSMWTFEDREDQESGLLILQRKLKIWFYFHMFGFYWKQSNNYIGFIYIYFSLSHLYDHLKAILYTVHWK